MAKVSGARLECVLINLVKFDRVIEIKGSLEFDTYLP